MSPLIEMSGTAALASVRLSALFISAPVFSHRAVPMRLRAALGLAVASLVAPDAPADLLESSGASLALLVLREALVGLFLGFAAGLVFAGFDLLGEFVSVQGGLGAASVVDPASGSSSLALASTLRTFALLAFVAIDGHHEVLRAAVLSYEALPLASGAPSPLAFLELVRMGSEIFEIAVRLAAPITVAMLVSNLGMGILGRTIPQLNLMMLQLPAHVAFSLGLLMLGAGTLVEAAGDVIAPWPGRALAALLAGR